MPDKADKLVKLAEQKFPKLLPFTAAEEKMLRAAAEGETAYCNFGGDIDPASADKWSNDRTIRVEILRWLCIDTKAQELVDPWGIQVKVAKIDGNINLAFANVPFPLALFSCAAPDGIDLMDAETRSLNFSTSHIGLASEENEKNIVPLRADRLIAKGGLFLWDVVVHGEVSLARAKITGDMICVGGQFKNEIGEKPKALNADGAEIGGSVFLQKGFHATGEVRLFGAKIKGNLDCQGGQFKNKNEYALNAGRAEVGGSVFFNEKSCVTGEVRLVGAKIAGQLNCNGGQFINPDGNALSADGAEIGGGVFLGKGDEKDATPFEAHGEVRLLGAKIRGPLSCSGGQFENKIGKEPKALSADGVEINGSVFLNDDFHATGEVCLLGVKITGQLICRNGQFENENARALTTDDAEIGGGLVMDEGFRIKGWLSLAHASVGVLVDDPKCWPAQGRLVIDGFEYRAINSPGPTDARSRKDWLERQYPKDAKRKNNLFRSQPYEQLAAVLHQIGHKREAKKILIAKEDARRKYSKMSFMARLWHGISKYTTGYSYHMWLLSIWMATLFVITGWFVFNLAGATGGMVPAGEGTRPAFNAFVYSVDSFIQTVNLHQEKYWQPVGENYAGSVARIYLWVHIVLGWVATIIFVGGVTGIVQKELPKK